MGPRHLMELWKEKFRREHTRVVFVTSFTGTLAKEEPLSGFDSEETNRQYAYSKRCISVYACQCMEEDGLEVVLVHPGISVTNIIFGKDSKFPESINRAGRKLLDRFPDKGSRASMVSVRAICEPYHKYLFIRPRLFFGIFGLPRVVKMQEKFQHSDMLET